MVSIPDQLVHSCDGVLFALTFSHVPPTPIDKLIRPENTASRSVRFDRLIRSENTASRSVRFDKLIRPENTASRTVRFDKLIRPENTASRSVRVDKLIRPENTASRSVRFDRLIRSENTASRSVRVDKLIRCISLWGIKYLNVSPERIYLYTVRNLHLIKETGDGLTRFDDPYGLYFVWHFSVRIRPLNRIKSWKVNKI